MSEPSVGVPRNAGIAEIQSIRDRLLEAARGAKPGKPLSVDLSGVVEADSSLAQLLIALKAEAAAKGFELAFNDGDPEAWIRALLACDEMGAKRGVDAGQKGGSR